MTHSRFRRPHRLFVAAVVLLAVSSLVVTGWERPATGVGPNAGKITLYRLKLGLGCWESGGSYAVTNAASGAYGKYQIMPANWPGWARQYLGRGRAKPTAANQEQVASGKLTALQAWLIGWDRVLYWWLTGKSDTDRTLWTDTANRYVDGILSIANRAATAKGRMTIPMSCFSRPPDPTPVGQPGPPHNTIHRRVIASVLRVRAHPGAHKVPLGSLHRGDVVAVVGTARDRHGRTWIHIARAGSPNGWVARWLTVLLH